jgi:hypothetical protein
VKNDARWRGLGIGISVALARHFLKHPIDCANMEVHMPVQATTIPYQQASS